MQMIHYLLIAITLSGTRADDTECLFRMVNSNTSVKKIDIIGNLPAASLVVCSLKCCNAAQCGWISMRTGNDGGYERRCLMLMNHAKSSGGSNIDIIYGEWDIYKKETSAKRGEVASTHLPLTHETTTTTTTAPAVLTLPPTATLYERIKHICEVAKAGSLPIYSRINSVNKWRCHAKSELVLNQKFYGGGRDYIESKDDEIKKTIDEHPSTSNYYVGGAGLSCQNVCSKRNNKVCQSNMYTLNSAYFFFAKAGIQCNFGKSEATWSGSSSMPYYEPGENRCRGFVGIGTVDCNHSPGHGRRRLCRCL